MSNQGPRRAVKWSPLQDDRVLIAGTDLRLFEVRSDKFCFEIDTSSGNQTDRLESEKARSQNDLAPLALLAANGNDKIIKTTICDWYRGQSSTNDIVAVGNRYGSVIVTGIDSKSNLGAGLGNSREFSPKVSRPCSQLKWNPTNHTQLAIGLEKLSREPALLLWDVSSKSLSLADKRRTNSVQGMDAGKKSFGWQSSIARTSGPLELAGGEGVLSLEWIPGTPDTLLVGIGAKYIRRFDFREGQGVDVANARGAYCLAIDPNNPTAIATYSPDKLIKLWDSRHFANPITTIPTPKETVVQLSWCPTRRSLLGALVDEQSTVRLYDTHLIPESHRESSEYNFNAMISSRQTIEQQTQKIVNFDWHPTRSGRMMTITEKGTVCMSTSEERAACDISPKGEIIFCQRTSGSPLKMALKPPHDEAIEDISIVMRRRAQSGAGVQMQKNSIAYEESPNLADIWTWLDRVYHPENWVTCFDGSKVRTSGQTILCLRDALSFTGSSFMGFTGVASDLTQTIFATFDSTLQRSLAVMLCGWVPMGSRNDSLNEIINNLEGDLEFERAAAIAIFHQDVPRAIQSLQVGANIEGENRASMLAAAMALSGFAPSSKRTLQNEQSNQLWRDTCARLLHQVPSPYLRCALEFLTTTDRTYSAIVDEQSMKLVDRVAFACRYLSDENLEHFLASLSASAEASGSLRGLFVEGFSEQGINIIGAYVNNTADVQTASILIAHAHLLIGKSKGKHPSKVDPRAQDWIDSYRDLLDQWQLWMERAKFDVERNIFDSKAISAQIFFRCGFCNKSVAQLAASRGSHGARIGNSRRHVNACNCRNALPKCTICWMPLGTTSNRSQSARSISPRGAGNEVQTKDSSPPQKMQPFGSWFSWCQSCQHGGHASCLASWFDKHTECPVPDCSCKCVVRDVDRSHEFIHT